MDSKDYRWTLIYIGKTKTFQLSEHRFAGEDWIPLTHSSWDTLPAALNHIERTTQSRDKEREA